MALTGTGQSRRALSFTSQLLEYSSEYGCTHLFCVFIVADIGSATDRSPFIRFLTNLPNIYNINTKSVQTEDMHTEKKKLAHRVLRTVGKYKFALHTEVLMNFQALCDVKSCRLANNYRIFGGNVFSTYLPFRGSYNKINEMHYFLKFILGIELYMFRTVPLSIIRSPVLYTQQ